jgi:ferredoxin-NAD(P)+ reductase (naphthalene dioxygenase ferredoxin-specific)
METAGPLPSFTECLACQTVPMTDCLIEIPDQNFAVNLPARNDRATVLSVDALALDVMRLTLEVKRPLQYLGGQHFELGFGSNLRRMYSVSGASRGTRITFDIQVHPYGVASGHIRNTIRAGDQVRIRGPLGDAYLRADTSKLLLVSSGTGLGPMLGLMADCAATGIANPIYVYVGFSFSEHVYGREELQTAASALKNLRKCEIVIASGALRRGERRGLLTDALESDIGSFRGWRTHVFGTPTAVESCARLLLARDLSPRMLHKVAFSASVRL